MAARATTTKSQVALGPCSWIRTLAIRTGTNSFLVRSNAASSGERSPWWTIVRRSLLGSPGASSSGAFQILPEPEPSKGVNTAAADRPPSPIFRMSQSPFEGDERTAPSGRSTAFLISGCVAFALALSYLACHYLRLAEAYARLFWD
jgi:hypothetical protein